MAIVRAVVLAALVVWIEAALAQAPPSQITVARGNENYPPFEMRNEGRLTGYHVDLVDAVAEKLGLKVNWLDLPWARAQHLVATGEADAVTYLTQTAEREAWAIFLPGNALSNPVVRFMIHKSTQGNIAFTGDQAEFLKNRVLLTINGYYYSDVISKTEKYETNSLDSLVTMMMARRYDIAAVNEGPYAYTYSDRPEFNALVLLDPPIRESRVYIAFSKAKGHEALAARFESALNEFRKTRKYTALRAAYRLK